LKAVTERPRKGNVGCCRGASEFLEGAEEAGGRGLGVFVISCGERVVLPVLPHRYQAKLGKASETEKSGALSGDFTM